MGKAQPADVGLNCIIKLQLKQSQVQFLVDSYQAQIVASSTLNNVKFSMSLPILCDATVAGIMDVYDFMTGPTGHELVKKASLKFFDMSTIHLPGMGDVPLKSGTSRVSVS